MVTTLGLRAACIATFVAGALVACDDTPFGPVEGFQC
jgi:hypothetical protein